MPDLWPELRQAVADTARQHWAALRLIAPDVDPRTIAAESVATSATACIQDPALWQLLHLTDAMLEQPARAKRLLLSAGLAPGSLTNLSHRLTLLDHAARAWTAEAYGRNRHA